MPGCSQRLQLCIVSHRMAASPPSGIAYKGSIPALPAAHRSQRLAQQSRPGLGGATPRLHRSDRTAKSRQDWPGRHTLLQDPPGLLRAHAIPREDIEDCLGDAFGQTGPPPTYVTAPGRIVAGNFLSLLQLAFVQLSCLRGSVMQQACDDPSTLHSLIPPDQGHTDTMAMLRHCSARLYACMVEHISELHHELFRCFCAISVMLAGSLKHSSA